MFETLIRPVKILLLALLLSASASALQVVIMDRDLQTTLGTGQSAGGRLNLQLADGAAGPVVVFIKDDNGKSSSFSGEVRGGQVVLESGSLATLLQARGVTLVLPAARPNQFNAPSPSAPTDASAGDDGNKGNGNSGNGNNGNGNGGGNNGAGNGNGGPGKGTSNNGRKK